MKASKFFKKINSFILILCISAFALSSSFSVPVYASNNSDGSSFWGDVGNAIQEIGKKGLVAAVRTGSYSAGAAIGGPVGSFAVGGLVNGFFDWYDSVTDSGSGKTESGNTINYYANRGIPTSYNSTTYNQVESRSIFNQQKTESNTYNYRWYNPVTHTYDITNSYTYNTEYNTYNYTTYNVTNNYTTNYYIQDNRTYVSYYIINTNNDTGEEEETYLELYYQLPDGRNSYNLKASDLKGVYFPSKYSKYVSNAEDDGTTLGLWHLDGDLKDSSYWENTAGNAYNNKYTDGLYTSGKLFSDNSNDYLRLNLDNVNLPSTWTLEWCEYIPDVSFSYTQELSYRDTLWDSSLTKTDSSGAYCYYWSGEKYYLTKKTYLNNYISLEGDSKFYLPSEDSFVPYALVKSSSGYKFYVNGSLVDSVDFSDKDAYTQGEGISVTSDSIEFKVISDKLVHSSFDNKGWYLCESRSSASYKYYYHSYFNYYLSAHKNAIIDEVRLSSGVLYSGDSYTPSSQPFTTNSVLTVPENPEKHEISFRTNTELSDVRFGGVRQTYPTNGTVYVALDDNQKVESVQQYRQDGWYEIEASIYYGDEWTLLKGFDLSKISVDSGDDNKDPDNPDKPTNPDKPVDPDNPDNPDDDKDSGLLGSIGKLLSSILKGLGSLISPVIEGIASLLEGITGAITSITSFISGSFGDFLSSSFSFIPQDIVNVVVLGVSLVILATVIKIFKG